MQLLDKPAPEPKESSCLTCRKRRKKCDKARPVCQRCATSGFGCSGYDKDEGEVGGASKVQGRPELVFGGQEPNRSKHKPIRPRPAVESVSYIRQQSRPRGRTEKEAPLRSSLNTTNGEHLSDPIPSLLQTLPVFELPIHPICESKLNEYLVGAFGASPALGYNNTAYANSTDSSFNDLWPQNQFKSLARPKYSLQAIPVMRNVTNRTILETASITNELSLVMNFLCRHIPHSVNTNAPMRASYFSYAVSQYKSQQVRQFFRPPPVFMSDGLAARLSRAGATLWFFYLGAKIFEQMNKGHPRVVARPFIHWIINVTEQVTSALNPNLSVGELEVHLTGLLELVFLKFVAINTQAGYSLLRRSVPVFIALVSSDSSLWVENQGLLSVSVTRALDFHRHEIKRFVFRDSMIAFALGTPSLVQYDTSDCSIIPVVARPLEWTHGIPTEFVLSVVQVNAWRVSNPGIPNANDWPELVLRTLTWTPRVMDLVGVDSREDSYSAIARLAVQETWRHAVLIYIYTGMCLVNSHDPRVQHSVQQILQLKGVLSESPLDIQLILPYLSAGLAARYEHQRAAVRDKISSFLNTRIWLLPGAEFIKVLDHLWHGVAAGGAPVTWDDYVYSRRTMLPIT